MWTFLCVDDNPDDIIQPIAALRDELSARIIIAESFPSALDLLDKYSFDCFIIDIELSDRHTGIQLAQKIRMSPSYLTTPIVFASMYSHYSKRLLSTISNCSFLSKPISSVDLMQSVGSLLHLPKFLPFNPPGHLLTIPIPHLGYTEINLSSVSYIEVNQGQLTVQYIDGQIIRTKCQHGCFKTIILHIQQHSLNHLKQIHRSVIVNIDQIKSINQCGTSGLVYLFGDSTPKPLGLHYRNQLSELL